MKIKNRNLTVNFTYKIKNKHLQYVDIPILINKIYRKKIIVQIILQQKATISSNQKRMFYSKKL